MIKLFLSSLYAFITKYSKRASNYLSPSVFDTFFQDDFVMKAIGLGVYIIAAITDYYDGYYARKFGIYSDFGAFLDPQQINFNI